MCHLVKRSGDQFFFLVFFQSIRHQQFFRLQCFFGKRFQFCQQR